MREVGDKYEAAIKDCVPGSGHWDNFDRAYSMKTGEATNVVLPLWFHYEVTGKRGATKKRKGYVFAEFCPFCGKRTEARRG